MGKIVKVLAIILLIGIAIALMSFLEYKKPSAMSEKPPVKIHKGWMYRWGETLGEENDYIAFDFPGKVKSVEDEKILWARVTLPEVDYSEPTIFFRSSQQIVEVYLDKQLIYSYGGAIKKDSLKPPGTNWHFVRLPENYQGKVLEVKIYSPFYQFTGYLGDWFIGEKSDHILKILREYIFNLVLAVIFIFLGISMQILFISLKMRHWGFLYLGLFSTLAGVWIFCESRVIQLLFGDPIILMYTAFASVYLAPISFVLFFDCIFPDLQRRNILRIMAGIFAFFAISSFLLEAAGLVSIFKTAIIFHILIAVTMIFFVVLLVEKLLKGNTEVVPFLVGYTILCTTLIIDILGLFYFYQSWIKSSRFSHFGLFFFVLSLTYLLGKRIMALYEKEKTDSLLKQMAYHDGLTSLYNRAYFEEQVSYINQNIKEFLPVHILYIDINNLKLVNDTLGHKAGDDLIKAAGRVICDAFSQEGNVCRIGGDEFAVILTRAEDEKAENRHEQLLSLIERHNSANPVLPLSMAVGMAKYKEGMDKDLFTVVNRADDLMYNCKLRQKSCGNEDYVNIMLASLSERDYVSSGHIQRLFNMAVRVSEALELAKDVQERLLLLVRLHDIGKINLPDEILFKKGQLTKEEFERVKMHSRFGFDIANRIYKFSSIANLILYHHEWWNGNGYPSGLKGESIPLECRILTVLDAYDVMTMDTNYKKSVDKASALKEIQKMSGVQFDPEIVKVFLKVHQDTQCDGKIQYAMNGVEELVES